MESRSCFQTLPEHIVQQIVGHCLDEEDSGLNNSAIAGLSLLHSCHIWRMAFIKESLSVMETSMCNTSRDVVSFPRWPPKLKAPVFSTAGFVKKIRILYNSWQPVVDGTALELIESVFPAGTSFELVRHIDITINIRKGFDTLEALDGLGKMLLYIKGLAPRSEGISFYDRNLDSRGSYAGIDGGSNDVVLELIRGMREVNMWHLQPMEPIDYLDPTYFVNLTRFCFDCYGDSAVFNAIIRNNARTLRVLHADYEFDCRIDTILYDEKGGPVVYECLESLTIWADKTNPTSRADSHHLHFPAIKSLCVSICDSPCYDVFFDNRIANYDGLRSLDMLLVPEYIAGARGSFAFSSRQLANVRSMIFEIKEFLDSRYYSSSGEANQANARFIDMLVGIPTALSYLRISGNIAENPFVNLMTSRCRFESLQNLDILDVTLGFNSVLAIIRAAPLLCTLRSRIRDEYPNIQDVAPENLVQHVKAKLHSLGRYVIKISLNPSSANHDPNNYCMAMALLTIVCPRLANLSTHARLSRGYKSMFLKLSKTEDFREHRDHFELLARSIPE